MHCLACAVIAEILAKSAPISFLPGDMFTAGLLSQIAWPSIVVAKPDEFLKINQLINEQTHPVQIFLNNYDLDPCYLSACIIERIGMPPWISTAVAIHNKETNEKLSDRILHSKNILATAAALAQKIKPFLFSDIKKSDQMPTKEMISAWGEWIQIIK